MRTRIFISIALFSCSLVAYSEPATVSGTLSDSSGAILIAGKVSLHQIAGSVSLTTATDRSGHFLFAAVTPGEYLVDASAPGLTLAQPPTLTFVSGQKLDLMLRLSVSAITTQVSVTGAGAPQSAGEVSKALDIVNVADVEQRGIFSVAEAVRFIPGLRVSVRGSPGTFTTIQTRGLRVTDTAVLIDGFAFRDATSIQDEASAYIGDLLLVDSSRIEVLRGSGSSLYGSNAMSGTVNIITDTSGGPIHGDIDVQGGGLGLFQGVARVAGGVLNNRLTYSAGLSHLNVTEGVDDVGAVRDWNGQGSLNYAVTPRIRISANVFANTGYLQQNASPSPTLTAPVSGIIPAIPLSLSAVQLADTNQPYNAGSATFIPSLGDPDSGRYSHFINSLFHIDDEVNSRLSYRIGYGIVDTVRDNTNGAAGPQNEYTFQPLFNTASRYAGRIDTLQARVNYLLGAHQILTAGYEFQRENYGELDSDQNPDPTQRTYERTNGRQQSNAVFAQDEIHFLDGRLQVLLSGRFTRVALDQPIFVGGASPYAAATLPSPPEAYTGDASISYFLRGSGTKLRAHVGNSFRAPSIYERFGGYFYGGTYFPIGDPRLAPERAVSGDFGFDQYLFHERLKISSTYFYAHLQQVIAYLNFPPGYVDQYGRTGGYYNTGGGISRGVEVSGELRPTRKSTITASYVYTNAIDRTSQYYTGTAIDPLQTPRILPNMVTIVATQQIGKHIDAAMDFEGGSSYLYPLYGYDQNFNYQPFAYRFNGPRLMGISAGYSINVGERATARFYTRISNGLNQNFYEDGFQTPGRWAVGGIQFKF